jgi:hypothetical protein
VSVIVAAEAGVPESTLTVATDVKVPPGGGVTAGDENETCTPAGRAPVLRATPELNDPIDVTVTVSVADPPAPTLRAGELSDIEKSAPEVTVSANDVVRVIDPPVPTTVIVFSPSEAPDPTEIPRLAEAEPPDGIEIGLGLKVENVTPAGTAPVTDNVTGPEKLSIELPVIVTVPEAPCGIEIVGGVGLRPKSGAVGVSLASLFVPLSAIHTLLAASTTTSCGELLPTDHSVNWPLGAPMLVLLIGVAVPVVGPTGAETAGVIGPDPTPAATTVGAAPFTVPPADGSS